MTDWNERVRIARRVAERTRRKFEAAAENYTAARQLLLEAHSRFHAAGEHWNYAVAYSIETERRARESCNDLERLGLKPCADAVAAPILSMIAGSKQCSA
jgi:hypothetical protein